MQPNQDKKPSVSLRDAQLRGHLFGQLLAIVLIAAGVMGYGLMSHWLVLDMADGPASEELNTEL